MNTITFKKKFAVLSILIILTNTFLIPPKIKSASESLPQIVFPVISDIHIGGLGADKKFQNALADYKMISPNYDCIAIVGDITNEGKENQYQTFMQILNSDKVKNATGIVVMGNHEYMAGDLTKEGYEARFVKETGMSSLYYDQWIKDYHFIALAPENIGDADLSNKQLNWLSEKLKEKQDKIKPIFVFLHQPFTNTVYGSQTWGGIKNYKKLYGILKKYPQVILFTGHSHYTLDNPRTMYKNRFSMFNTSAVYYTMEEGDKYRYSQLSEGLLVEVYEKKVVVKCREFSKHQWIGKIKYHSLEE